MAQPEVESEATVQAPANGGTRQRSADEVSQPAKLKRPLEESARLANERTTHTLIGVEYDVSAADGYRKA
jgi:hypothetical protein